MALKRATMAHLEDSVNINERRKIIYEAKSQVEALISEKRPFFRYFRAHMSQSVEKYLDVVETLLMVR